MSTSLLMFFLLVDVRFAEPLWLLAVPGLLLIFIGRWYALTARGLGMNATVSEREQRPRYRLMWRSFSALLLCVIALARPFAGETNIRTETTASVRHVLIALDVSRSMLVEDVPPNRLERARLIIRSLLDELRGDHVGLILFAGTAFLQCPMSTDQDVLREMLPVVGPNFIPLGGTDYEAMLRIALDSFPAQEGHSYVLIVVSDGESLNEEWRLHIPRLNERRISVVTLGVGTLEGGLVPAERGGFERDSNGAVVISRIEPRTLQELAEETGGMYLDATRWIDIATVIERVEKTKATATVRQSSRVIRNEIYYIPLWPAFVMLLWALLSELSSRPVRHKVKNYKKTQLSNKTLAKASGQIALLLVALLLTGITNSYCENDDVPILLPQIGPSTEQSSDSQLDPLGEYLQKIQEIAPRGTPRSASMLEDIANSTITVLEHLAPEMPASLLRSVVSDGLAAVDRGEMSFPNDADWKTLREKLERFLKKNQQSREKQKQEQNSKENQQESPKNQSEQNQDKENSAGEQKQQNQDKEEEQNDNQGGEQNKQQDSQKSSQGKSGQSGEDKQEGENQSNNNAFPKQNDRRDEEQRSQNTGGEKPLQSSELSQPQQPPQTTPIPGPKSAEQAPKGDEPPKIGGHPVQGRAEDLSSLPQELREALLRLERARENDRPAVLFQRMTGEQQKDKRQEKNW